MQIALGSPLTSDIDEAVLLLFTGHFLFFWTILCKYQGCLCGKFPAYMQFLKLACLKSPLFPILMLFFQFSQMGQTWLGDRKGRKKNERKENQRGRGTVRKDT